MLGKVEKIDTYSAMCIFTIDSVAKYTLLASITDSVTIYINIMLEMRAYTYCYNINTETQAQCNFSGRQDNASSSESSIS